MCRLLMCKPLRHFPGNRLVATFPPDWPAAHYGCLPAGSQGGELARVFCR
jgi:hypothetical protein